MMFQSLATVESIRSRTSVRGPINEHGMGGRGGRKDTEEEEKGRRKLAYQVPPWRRACCEWFESDAGRSADDVSGAGADWLRLASFSTSSKTPPSPTIDKQRKKKTNQLVNKSSRERERGKDEINDV